jgi:hypothetical protein
MLMADVTIGDFAVLHSPQLGAGVAAIRLAFFCPCHLRMELGWKKRMNRLSWQRVAPLLAEVNQAVLATCGDLGPTASVVSLLVQDERLYLCLADASEHLFNLLHHPEIVLVSRQWELHGNAVIEREGSVATPLPWQIAVRVSPRCLHILSEQGTHNIETIDFQS